MTAPANRWKLGLLVVTGCAAGLAVLTWVGVRELRKESLAVHAYFDEAVTGLEVGSPVKYRGVTVGVVDDIGAAPDRRHLEVRFALYDDKLARLGIDVDRLDESSPNALALRAQIVMSWVTGTSFVQVDYFPDPPSGPQNLPFRTVGEKRVLLTVPSTAKSLEDASRDVLRVLRPGGIWLIGTANAASWTAALMGARWQYLNIDAHGGHVSFFSPRSIAVLATRSGFSVERIDTRNVRMFERHQAPGPVYALAKLAAEVVGPLARASGRGHDMLAWLRKPEEAPAR